MKTITITLNDYKAVSWNQLYAGKHWSVRKQMAEEAHFQVRCAVIDDGLKMQNAPVDIEIVAHLRRRIDPDNLCAKLVIDGLKGLVIPDDSSKHVLSVKTRCVKSVTNYTQIFIHVHA